MGMQLKRYLFPVTLLAALIALWWGTVLWTKSVIFPTPLQVVTGIWELARDGTLWDHVGASLMRVGAGFGLAVLVSLPLGLWMGRVQIIYTTLNPIVQILRPISPIAWIPIAILWFGVGNLSPIFLIFMLEATRYIDLPLSDERVAAVRFMIVGAVLMLLVVFRPQGLFGKKEELALRGR